MDIDTKKLDLIDWLVNLRDEEVIEELCHFKQENSSVENSYEDLPQAAKDSIERGLKDIEEGRVSSHEDVMKRLRKKHPYLK